MITLEKEINKTDRFKNKAIFIHNNLYNYNNVDYKKAHNKLIKHQYVPKIKFDGNTECFSLLNLN